MDKINKYYLLAKYNAELFSKDPNTKVGALIMKPDLSCILSTGINGMPRKVKDDDPVRWQRPTKYKYCSHAELNAVCNAAKSGTATEGASAIVTLFPCSECCKALIQAGIKTVYTPPPNIKDEVWGDSFTTSLIMFEESGMNVVYI